MNESCYQLMIVSIVHLSIHASVYFGSYHGANKLSRLPPPQSGVSTKTKEGNINFNLNFWLLITNISEQHLLVWHHREIRAEGLGWERAICSFCIGQQFHSSESWVAPLSGAPGYIATANQQGPFKTSSCQTEGLKIHTQGAKVKY